MAYYNNDSRAKKIYQEASAAERLTTWTEVLGYESLGENAKWDNLFGSTLPINPPLRSRNAVELTTPVEALPRLLATSNENGRPNFNLLKLRENGRLKIGREQKERPEVLVSRTRNRVRMRFITPDDDDGIQECDQEKEFLGLLCDSRKYEVEIEKMNGIKNEDKQATMHDSAMDYHSCFD